MKKTILTSIFALFAVTTLFAQSANTYNMQIELKNGTKVTLGPNDLKNISFNGDALEIKGNTIDDLFKKIDMTQAQIAALENVIAKNQKEIEDLKQNQGGSGTSTDTDKKIAELQDDIAALAAMIKNLQAQQDNLLMQVKQLEERMAATEYELKSQEKDYLTQIENLNDKVTKNAASIDALNNAVAALKQNSEGGNAEVETQIMNLQTIITALQADQTASKDQLANVENELKAVEAKLAEVTAMMAIYARKEDIAELQAMLQAQMKAQTAQLEEVQENGKKNVAMLQEQMAALQAKLQNEVMENKVVIDDLKDHQNRLQEDVSAVLERSTENTEKIMKVLLDKIDLVMEELRLFEEFVQTNMPFNESFEQWKEKQQ